MVAFNPDDTSRFDKFTILTTPYKTVHGHDITLDVLYPKEFKPSPNGQPILIRYHGGGLTAGASLFPDMFGRWLLELAERHSAIIVSPDYRLIPEANSNDVLEDVEDSWKWVQTKLAPFLEPKTGGRVRPDPSRIVTAGESAGGYLSLVLSLSHADQIRATTAAYPMIDIKQPWFSEAYEKHLFDVPQLPKSIYLEHIESIKAQEGVAGNDGQSKKVVASSDPKFDRAILMFAFVQHGLYPAYFDSSSNIAYPLERIEAGQRFPKGGVFVWHGSEDSVVPIEQSRSLAKKVKELQPDAKFLLTERPGDHGFDGEAKIDDDWLRDGLNPLVDAWLA
ncbi:hypothetical protein DV737_g1898, partial [Chaetothyriales sp. CBS 132003]